MKQTSLGEDLVRALVGLPKFLIEYFVGLVHVILTDYYIFTFLLAAVLFGVARESVLEGFLAFFVIYSLFRVLTAGLSQIAESIAYHARVTNPPQPEIPPTVPNDF
jgi:hypothetical protein